MRTIMTKAIHFRRSSRGRFSRRSLAYASPATESGKKALWYVFEL
jgi:hypothetical protein